MAILIYEQPTKLRTYLNYSRMRPVVVEQFSHEPFIITANFIRFITRPSIEARKLGFHEAFKQRFTKTELKQTIKDTFFEN